MCAPPTFQQKINNSSPFARHAFKLCMYSARTAPLTIVCSFLHNIPLCLLFEIAISTKFGNMAQKGKSAVWGASGINGKLLRSPSLPSHCTSTTRTLAPQISQPKTTLSHLFLNPPKVSEAYFRVKLLTFGWRHEFLRVRRRRRRRR